MSVQQHPQQKKDQKTQKSSKCEIRSPLKQILKQKIYQIIYNHNSNIQKMAAFNIESQFLNLNKTYQNFEYEHLIQEAIVTDDNNQIQNEAAYQGMTQNTYLFVQEKNVLLTDIENLALYFEDKYVEPNPKIKEKAKANFPFDKIRDRICLIFQKYQQQPSLLDSLLQPLIHPLMNSVKHFLSKQLSSNLPPPPQLHHLLLIVYMLCKVRGKKYVLQYLPHETKDLYPALAFLVRERDSKEHWESKYVILLWLGVIVLLPFNLDTMDSGVLKMQDEKGEIITDIVSIMIAIGKFYLKSLTKSRQAAALFLSKLFTRPDIQKQGLLSKYIDGSIQKLEEAKNNPMQNFLVCGIIYSLHQIFKRVQRKQLLLLIDPVLDYLKNERETVKDNALKKEMKMKLLTQIGLTYLKPRNASWAYKKKTQSLLTNLSKTLKKVTIQTNTVEIQQKKQKNSQVETNEQNELEYYRDVNKSNLEEIVDMMIQALNQKQTQVREKAAKGIGKICGRLSQDMVLDVVEYILQLTPTPQSMHAVCLTLAELIKRNLISPQKLESLYPFICDALLYEQEQGGYSVGQAVRDAACYIAWSAARGYQQGGRQLGVGLMLAACFDREVGCRRAASAAYQQLVGRCGDVPFGIQILTQADYFTLGLQKNAYLNVAIFVAGYQPYFKPFVEHLCNQKLRHWDLQIKRIAACSLSLMTPLSPNFMSNEILPALLTYFNKQQQQGIKLGCIIGIGQILLGLKGKSFNHQLQNQMKDSVFLKSLTQNQKKLLKAGEYMQKFKEEYAHLQVKDNFSIINSQLLSQIVNSIIAKIKQGKIYKGKSGQNFRIYTLRLIECFSICGVPLNNEQITVFQDFIEQNIKNPLEPIIVAAVKSLKPFLEQYYDSERDEKFIKNIINSAKNSSKTMSAVSKGYTLAISKFTKQIYLSYYPQISSTLQQNAKVSKQNSDPQCRKYSIMAIEQLINQLGFNSFVITQQEIQRIFGVLFQALGDYTMDKRGDIGSIVREASMTCLIAIIRKYQSEGEVKTQISNELVTKTVALMLQQLSEKIDRIRLLAGSLLQQFFDKYSYRFSIADQEHLSKIFTQQNIKSLIKQTQEQVDSNLQTDVIKMQMRIQQTIFQQTQKYLIYFWNQPRCTFPIVVPLLELQNYSYWVFKGLCTSTGGLSQSIIKYSLQELGNYITHIFEGKEHLMDRLISQSMQLMQQHFKEDRIIVPLFKTLDYILERTQVVEWLGAKNYDTKLFELLEKEVGKSKNIVKVSAATGLYVALLSINNPQIREGVLKTIVKILCSDLPKARKVLADKLLLLVMSQDEKPVFSDECTEQLMNILSENDFLDEKLDVTILREQIQAALLL